MHVDASAQELLIGTHTPRHPPLDHLQRVQCIGELLLLVMDAGETEGGFVLDRLGDVALEYGLDRAAGLLMHAVGQLEVPHRKFRLTEVHHEGVQLGIIQQTELLQFRIETDNGIEIFILVCVKQGFTKEQIFQLFGLKRRRVLGLFCMRDACSTEQYRKTTQRSASNCAGQAGKHAYQSLKLIADWAPAIWISTNLGPTAFSTLNVAVPRYSLPDLDLPK